MARLKLRDGWYLAEVDASTDLNRPGIYEWRVEGVGVYVGKALTLKKRIRAYPNNVRRMIEGLPWHGNPNRKYRTIHEAMRRAYGDGIKVTVRVLETCSREDRAAREKEWIALRRAEHARGGLPVLND